MIIRKISAEDWNQLSEIAHKAVFGKIKPASWDRISYALVVEAGGVPVSYVTVREHDHESVYWQFGGTLPENRTGRTSIRAALTVLNWTKERYRRASFMVENTNAPMLKLAMALGFKVIGVRNFNGSILLEHILEF